MSFSFLNDIYSKSPVFLQNGLISAYGYYWKNRRLGGLFLKELEQWRLREKYTTEEWKDYQTQELRKLLLHAFETVPFYSEKYKKEGFSTHDFKNFKLSDIHKLPFLEKEEVRKYGTSTLLSTKKEKGNYYSSSGSTGTPVKIYISKRFHRQWNAAYEARVRNWAGVDYTMARGMIGGRRIISKTNPKKPYYRYNSAERQTYFSAYNISEKTANNYLKGIVDNKVEYMVGYAMSNYFLADFIEKSGLKAPKLKAVLTSSEKLTPEMRATFKRVYDCKTFDAYSGVEACGLISEHLNGGFFLSPDTGILETLGEDRLEVTNGEEGEIVSTGLLNFDQPLIRYRIGDRAKKSKSQNPIEGIEMPQFDEISGRVEDVIISAEGKKMVRFHGVFIDVEGLIVGQVVQESIENITLNLVVEKTFNKNNSEAILKSRIQSQLGKINIEIVYLDEIPKNNNGKFRAVISKI